MSATTRSDEVDIDIEHGAGGEWKVVTTAMELDDTIYYVQAAVPIGVQRATIQTVALFLVAGTPLLLGAVAVAVWMLVGRALRSVESIRTTVADIDAQRLTQRVAVPRTRDEIAALATTMNTMLDRLQASDRAQRAFVSDASHELRSPLATLTTAGELAVTASPDRQAALLATMNAEAARLRGLVENLMTLARADAQDLAIHHVDIDLDDLLADGGPPAAPDRHRGCRPRHRARPRGRRPATPPAGTPQRRGQRGPTCADQRPAHPHRDTDRGCASGSTTTGRPCPRAIGTASSNASSGWTRHAPATTVAAASVWRSPAPRCALTTATPPWSTDQPDGAASSSDSPASPRSVPPSRRLCIPDPGSRHCSQVQHVQVQHSPPSSHTS